MKPHMDKNLLESHEKDFLLKEFDTSWQQIIAFDNRRGIFFSFFNIIFVAVLTISSSLWVKSDHPSLLVSIGLTLIYIMTILVSYTIIKILESERSANVRYRKKINLIREIFLKETKNTGIQYYLTQSDIGIKLYSGGSNEINAVGGTLKNIYLLIHIEQAILVILIFGVWCSKLTYWFSTGCINF